MYGSGMGEFVGNIGVLVGGMDNIAAAGVEVGCSAGVTVGSRT